MKRIRKTRGGLLVAGLLLGAGGMALGQHTGQPPLGSSQSPSIPPASSPMNAADDGRGSKLGGVAALDDTDSTVRRNVDAIRANMANTERQRILTREATQLLRMAAELQVKIARNTGEISQEEIARQVDAIEKLARSVKDRMKGAR